MCQFALSFRLNPLVVRAASQMWAATKVLEATACCGLISPVGFGVVSDGAIVGFMERRQGPLSFSRSKVACKEKAKEELVEKKPVKKCTKGKRARVNISAVLRPGMPGTGGVTTALAPTI